MKKQKPKTIKIKLQGECEINFENVLTLKKEYNKDNIKRWNELSDEYTYEYGDDSWNIFQTLCWTLGYEIRYGKPHPCNSGISRLKELPFMEDFMKSLPNNS